MTSWTIRDLHVVQTRQPAAAGDDTFFVAVRAGHAVGWYGPVGERVGRYVNDVLAPETKDALVADHARLLDELRAAARRHPSEVASWAVGTVDCAVWDLHGRLAERSVAELLTRASLRPLIPAYASWLTQDLSSINSPNVLTGVMAGGWSFTKWGLRRDPAAPSREAATRMAQAIECCSEALGTPLAVDAVGTWTPAVALAFAQAVDPACLRWLEDPLPRHDADTYKLLAATSLPLAVGERAHCDEDPTGLIHYIRPSALTLDAVGCGGLTRAAQIIPAAQAQGVPVYPHGRSLLPGLHLAAAYPNAVPAVEYRLRWEPGRQRLYEVPLRPEIGRIRLPYTPGLGTTPRSTACPAPH
ncbi:enolase C-terminal domain-like protein [Streptomyces sp. SCSIO 30461]|uniref:enolase C-terminal domain-like protein n=1 Tax=Streptomyces sp. SCSIO 30461 TaxID=3118085 RepID=UPI0030D58E86